MAIRGSLSSTTTTRKDGVRVDKGIEPGEDHMRVHYRIVSEREDAAAVRVEEPLAASFPLDALDLDAAGGGDWLLDDASDSVALVDIVAAGEEVTTGYVVRCGDPNAVESVVDAPEIDMVDPVGGDGAGDGRGSNDRPSGVGEGGHGSASAREATQAEVAGAVDANAVAAAIDPGAVANALDADALAGALDAEAVVDAMDADAVAAALDAETVVAALDERAVANALPAGALVDALVAAVESDGLTDAQTDVLREGLAPAFSRSDDLRLAKLRARLEDFAAYADGLEAIIDEHGTATELVDDLRRDVDAATVDVDALEDSLAAASGEHAALVERFDAVDERLGTLADRVDALTERLDAVDDDLAQTDERHERLGARVAGVDRRVDAVDDDLASVRATLETFERTCEESMTELAAFASDLEDDVVEIDRWREQVGQAFTRTDATARAPDSIFRADEEAAAASDASTTDAPAGNGAGAAEPDGGLDYDPTRDDAEDDASDD